MSSYLHRLVHTVRRPDETVHPRSGSLFAPRWSEPDSPAELFEQAGAVGGSPEHSQTSTRGEPAETERHPTPADYAQSPLLPKTVNEVPRTFASVRRADVSRLAGYETQPDTPEHADQIPQRLVAPQSTRAVPDSRRDTGVQSYVPLIQPQPREANSTKPETPPFSTEARRVREASANLPSEGRSTGAEREPDEIQIHIGRIEVTAVHPPAPRAPKALDKTISLDAYLERRSGGPR